MRRERPRPMRGSLSGVIASFVLVGCGGGGGGITDVFHRDVLDTVEDTTSSDKPGPGADVTDTSGADTSLPPFHENPAHVLFDLFATPVQAPFPYDHYREPATGRLRLDTGPFSSALLPLVDQFERFLDAAGQMDGFATYAPLVFLSSVPLDASSLPADESASVQDDASVRLLELSADRRVLSAVPIRVEYREMEAQDGPRYLVTALPAILLRPWTSYLLLVTEGVRSREGANLGRSRGFAEVMGDLPIRAHDPERAALVERERIRLAPLVTSLPNASRVVAAADFTTGDAASETIEILKMFWKGGKYSRVAYDLDGDGDGQTDVFYGNAYPECPPEDDELAYGVAGVFEPVNLTGPDQTFVKKGDGWETFPPQRVRFFLMVPARATPAPVVLMAHGIHSDHSQLCDVARDLARAGLATVRFDLPRHGDRGGGATDFLDLTHPAKIRDNLRQSAVDLACLTLLVEALAEDLDLWPPDAPDGQGDLDASRIGFLGHSLGGIVGSVFVPLSDRVGPAVLNVSGVALTHMVESYVVPQGSGGMYEVMGMVHLAQHLLYPGDGVSFAHRFLREPLQRAHPVLVHEHMKDDTVPNLTTEVLARFAGIPLLSPYAAPVAGLEVVSASEATSGLWQVEGVSHGAFVKAPQDPRIALTRRQAAHFLWTALTRDRPEILSE